MKICGIIAEFNPLHCGHEYLLSEARKVTGADRLIVVMSGDYVQRGEPAIADKYLRTKMALNAGADLVLELPVPFSTGSARYFARGAIAALAHTGVVDSLLFGSESGTLGLQGSDLPGTVPFGAAQPAISRLQPFDERLQPNDLLAAEYLHALTDLKADHITPYTIRRIGAGHHDNAPDGKYASASYLRKLLYDDHPLTVPDDAGSGRSSLPVSERELLPEKAAFCLPDHVSALLKEYRAHARFLSLRDFSSQLAYRLLYEQENGYAGYFDVYEDLSRKIASNLGKYTDPGSFLLTLKSKDITYSHLSRALLHILLNIKKEDALLLCDSYDYCPWLRPLGFRTSSDPLLSLIRSNTDRPFLSKLADSGKNLDAASLSLLQKDITASSLYAHTADPKCGFPSDLRHPLVLL